MMVSPSASVAARLLLSVPPQSVANVRSRAAGASLTDTTVNSKDVEVDNAPSVTVTVMVVEPKTSVTGMREMVRSDPLPLKIMLAFGTIDVSELLAWIIKLSKAVLLAPTVTVMLAATSSSEEMLARVLMVGGEAAVVAGVPPRTGQMV